MKTYYYDQVAKVKEIIQGLATWKKKNDLVELATLKKTLYPVIQDKIRKAYVALDDRYSDQNYYGAEGDISLRDLNKLLIKFKGDDKSFRIQLNNTIDQIKDIVPAWGNERKCVFTKLYECIEIELATVTDTPLESIEGQFEEFHYKKFKKYVEEHGIPHPDHQYKTWRRIHLCASSVIWKTITIAAFERLAKVAFLDECRRRNLDVTLAEKLLEGDK